jgi:hypothetical protein
LQKSIESLVKLVPISDAVYQETVVAKPMLLEHASDKEDLGDIIQYLQPFVKAFPNLYKLYVSAATIGASTAVCESSFSCLSRVLTPFRRSMTHGRKSNLVILAAGKHRTAMLDLDKFLVEF